MSFCVRLTVILTIILCFGCKSQVGLPDSAKDPKIETTDDSRIRVLINQLDDRDEKVRQKTMKSLIDIAKESKISRDSVVNNLIIHFDIFLGDKNQTILPEDTAEVSSYLKLFLDLDAIEAIPVMVKYINSDEQTHGLKNTLIGRTVEQFGEDAIPDLSNGLNDSDKDIRCYCAWTLSDLKFKRDRDLGITQAIDALEKAKKNEVDKSVTSCINNAILTLGQRKLPNYPIIG